MKELKARTYVRPSSLGSYFGVGYNDPMTQFKIDTGVIEEEFDEAAQDRLNLGIEFEDASLNYFEEKFHCIIGNRNDKVYEIYDGKMRGKIDGMTWIDGEETVVENKISNSASEPFTSKLGYVIQVHCYMMATNTRKGLLCGLQNGKPIYRFIPYDQQIVNDIKIMVDFVVGMMKGEKTWLDYPADVAARYNKKALLPSITDMDADTEANMIRLVELRSQKSALEREIDAIMETITTRYEAGIYDKDGLKVIVTPVEGRVSYDIATLSLDHPEIDLSKYTRKSADYKQVRVTHRKK